MKHIFDPFGVFSEWKGQDPDTTQSWAQSIAQVVINDQLDNLSDMIADAVYTGMSAERERITTILKQELSNSDSDRIIEIINSDDE